MTVEKPLWDLRKVISGGQTGVDQAAWRAARSFGIETGGWMPKGFLTEDGPRPEFAEMWGAAEHPSDKYPPRTQANARHSDATLWLGQGDGAGFGCTKKHAAFYGKPFIVVEYGMTQSDVIRLLMPIAPAVLNVAGNRESKSPGIGERAESFLYSVFLRIVAGKPKGWKADTRGA